MQHHKLSTVTLIVVASTLLFSSTSALSAKKSKSASTATTTTTTTTTSSTAPAPTATAGAAPLAAPGKLEKVGFKGTTAPGPCHYPKILHDGFYVGGQMGYDAYRFRVSSDVAFPSGGLPTPSLAAAGNPVMEANGFGGGIFGGYGMYWQNYYYTGAEVFINGSTANQAQNFFNSDGTTMADYTKVSTNNMSWGISFIPGVKYSDSSLIYLRVGYSKAKLKGLNTISGTDPIVGGAASYSASKHQWAGGMSYGLGIETALYKRVSVRGEYNHYGYSSFSDRYATNYSPSNCQLMVSLIYHFV
ncbi:MAG: outer membrane beta-barrel protein [Pseudomonadota bacterium]